VLSAPVASVTKPCLELVTKELRPLLEQEAMGGALTPGEGTLLSDVKLSIENLLRFAFENYYALDKNSPKGIANGGRLFEPSPHRRRRRTAAAAAAPAAAAAAAPVHSWLPRHPESG
jgi:hypothetical protein